MVVDDNSVSSGQNKIVFTDGWCLVIGSENEQFDLADYDEGDVLKVTTNNSQEEMIELLANKVNNLHGDSFIK